MLSAGRVFVDLASFPIDVAEEPWDYTTVGQRFATAHSVSLARAGDTISEYGDIETLIEGLDGGRDWEREMSVGGG